MEFKQKLLEYQEIINKELEKNIIKQDCLEKTLNSSVEYSLLAGGKSLNSSVEYSLLAGGKRLRPILILASYELFKNDVEKCMPYAVALEMVHNFSLIHDDLPGIDNDDFRHGKLTNHKQFNEATAILAGDKLLNNSYKIISEDLLKTASEQELKIKMKIFNEFSVAIDKMIIGEYVDTEYEGKEITAEDLDFIHENKTGAFLILSVRIGAMLANASDKDLEKLTNYAKKIGLAFQVKDDILSEEGNEKILGKPVGLKIKMKIFNEFSVAIDKMIIGEYVDTEYEGKEITAEDLDFIHENKTGAFLILSVRIGAMLANSSDKDLEKLTNYAKKIGLAFQVKDDILSEEGNEKILGKPVGNDKKLKKCTYVSKYGLDKAKEILNQIIEDSIKEIAEYGEKATFLIELSRYIANRNK